MELKTKNDKDKNKVKRYEYWSIFEKNIYTYAECIPNIRELLESCKEEVIALAEKEGKDITQVKRKVAGDYFQAVVFWDIVDTATKSGLRALLNRRVQTVPALSNAIPDYNGTELKPDTDIVFYKPASQKPVYILSCKTSFRERLGQTGMWKLFYDMATYSCNDPSCPSHSFSLSGSTKRNIYTGFVTIDWYDELKSNDIADTLDFGYTANPKSVDQSKNVFSITEMKDHIQDHWSFL